MSLLCDRTAQRRPNKIMFNCLSSARLVHRVRANSISMTRTRAGPVRTHNTRLGPPSNGYNLIYKLAGDSSSRTERRPPDLAARVVSSHSRDDNLNTWQLFSLKTCRCRQVKNEEEEEEKIIARPQAQVVVVAGLCSTKQRLACSHHRAGRRATSSSCSLG